MPAARSLFLLLLGALFFASACTGPSGAQRGGPRGDDERPPAEEEPGDELPTPAPRRNLAEFEDFDPAPYRDEAPVTTVAVEHAVPARLLENRADAGVTRTVEGFRIQIYSSRDKAPADEAVEQAIAWWNAVQEERREEEEGAPAEEGAAAEEPLLPADLPVYVRYRQPYYRVRIGDFASRAEAERALRLIQRRFADAFIAPDTVTITR